MAGSALPAFMRNPCCVDRCAELTPADDPARPRRGPSGCAHRRQTSGVRAARELTSSTSGLERAFDYDFVRLFADYAARRRRSSLFSCPGSWRRRHDLGAAPFVAVWFWRSSARDGDHRVFIAAVLSSGSRTWLVDGLAPAVRSRRGPSGREPGSACSRRSRARGSPARKPFLLFLRSSSPPHRHAGRRTIPAAVSSASLRLRGDPCRRRVRLDHRQADGSSWRR